MGEDLRKKLGEMSCGVLSTMGTVAQTRWPPFWLHFLRKEWIRRFSPHCRCWGWTFQSSLWPQKSQPGTSLCFLHSSAPARIWKCVWRASSSRGRDGTFVGSLVTEHPVGGPSYQGRATGWNSSLGCPTSCTSGQSGSRREMKLVSGNHEQGRGRWLLGMEYTHLLKPFEHIPVTLPFLLLVLWSVPQLVCQTQISFSSLKRHIGTDVFPTPICLNVFT